MFCSLKLEAEPREAFRFVASPLASVPAMSRDSVRVLYSVSWFERSDVEPTDSLMATARPLKVDDVSPTEPGKILDREMCSRRLVDDPSELDADLTKPLLSEPPRESEPVNDLNHEP